MYPEKRGTPTERKKTYPITTLDSPSVTAENRRIANGLPSTVARTEIKKKKKFRSSPTQNIDKLFGPSSGQSEQRQLGSLKIKNIRKTREKVCAEFSGPLICRFFRNGLRSTRSSTSLGTP